VRAGDFYEDIAVLSASSRRRCDPGSRRRPQRFNQDSFSDLGTERQARVADHADDVRMSGQEPHDLVFAEPDFSQAIGHLRGSAKLFDPHSDASLDAVQRAQNICAGAFGHNCLRTTVRLHGSTLILDSQTHSTDFVVGQPFFGERFFRPLQEMVSLWQPW
jgi:hypothetical protein